MTDHTTYPDYKLDEALELTTPEHFKAISDPTRQKILGLLGQQALTTKQLSEILEQPRGTIGHHLKMLEAAGLIHVVRTRPVRAITEKYYGRVARYFRTGSTVLAAFQTDLSPAQPVLGLMLRQALEEMAYTTDPDDPSSSISVHARIPANEVREFGRRLEALAEEFRQRALPGEKVYGFVGSIYLTNWPEVPPAEHDSND
jgi:DNA-binding transcriptional ArsR family regulator